MCITQLQGFASVHMIHLSELLTLRPSVSVLGHITPHGHNCLVRRNLFRTACPSVKLSV